jgi:GTP-binding protein
MTPVIALVGRPNVGKSTLFNCLTKSRHALVSNFSGLTRDRQYGSGKINDTDFIVIDTGGVEGKEEGIDAEMLNQTHQAIHEANVIFFIVDAKAGLTSADEIFAQELRQTHKPIFLILNKIDGLDAESASVDFYSLGLGNPLFTAASQNRGVTKLIQHTLEECAEKDLLESSVDVEHRGIKLAIIGKPNVGKSTLVNRMLGEDRVVVYDQPGTTRDSIFIPLTRHDLDYTLIDTAGVRRKRSVSETIEKFSIVKTLQAIKACNVAILVIDAQDGITDQDLHLLGFIVDEGSSLIIAINKWDGLEDYQKKRVKKEIDRRLEFVQFAKIHFISALHGTGVGNLFDSAQKAYACATKKHTTNALTNILNDATKQHAPPNVQGRRIKLRYAHTGGHNPPIVVIHGSQAEKLSLVYQRFLVNYYRKALKLVGTPIRIELKTTSNPYEHIRNKLSTSQIQNKRRLMKFVKKRKKDKQQTR